LYWFDDGQVDGRGFYYRGTPVGDWHGFFENGQKKYECTYVDGKRHGVYRQWHKNGQKRVETNIVDGKLVGEVTFWLSDGTVDSKKSGNYVNGKKGGGEDVDPELLEGAGSRIKPKILTGPNPEKDIDEPEDLGGDQ